MELILFIYFLVQRIELVWRYIHTTVLLSVDTICMHVLISWVCVFFAGTWEFGTMVYTQIVPDVPQSSIFILGIYLTCISYFNYHPGVYLIYFRYIIFICVYHLGVYHIHGVLYLFWVYHIIWVYKFRKWYLGQIWITYIPNMILRVYHFLWYIVFIIILGVLYLIWVYKLRVWCLGQILTTYMSNLFWGIRILIIFLGIYIVSR